ncbi:16502_t:CDS:2 [Gigaspora margarita]|uniref:16502_t:CDS:1 n=1 Tax=Gigaspora margarita TaxID=4874 RepID=A0ABN7UK28_GIGMA|nr:16502_t:CDS:2 [Gigaspora margarita]
MDNIDGVLCWVFWNNDRNHRNGFPMMDNILGVSDYDENEENNEDIDISDNEVKNEY